MRIIKDIGVYMQLSIFVAILFVGVFSVAVNSTEQAKKVSLQVDGRIIHSDISFQLCREEGELTGKKFLCLPWNSEHDWYREK